MVGVRGRELLIFWGYFEVRAPRIYLCIRHDFAKEQSRVNLVMWRDGSREDWGRGVRSLLWDRSDFYVRCSSRNCKWMTEHKSLAFRGSSLFMNCPFLYFGSQLMQFLYIKIMNSLL